ncbi:DUF4350 domain-containing protein [Halobaculum sp. EA56]|uniref:DUF4350 domain-containing protein n=1 Tax=Halobaculum sp. EA56 TaxID=3421648 RepID=UPI003EBCC154
MRPWPDRWGYPHALAVGLLLVVVAGVLYAGVTSAAAFGTTNPAWDGASELPAVAADAGTEATVVTNVSAYRTADPNGSLAVVLSPTDPYTADEADTVETFVRRGGTLLVAEDVEPNGNRLLDAIGASTRVDGRPLRDEQEYYRSPAFPVASDVAAHPLTTGVDQVTLNHGSAVVPAPTTNATTVAATNATPVVNSSEFSYLDADRDGELDNNETLRQRPVVTVEPLGGGRVIVVSDPSVFINAMLDRPGNRQLARTVFAAHERVLLDYSHAAGQPPLAALLRTLRQSSTLTAAVAFLALLAIGAWVRLPAVRPSRTLAGRDPSAGDSDRAADPDTVIAALQRRHPGWDPRRLRRVMRGVLSSDDDMTEDE